MLKTGIVVETNKAFTYIVTCDSEFFNLKTQSGITPHIGEIYTGPIYEKRNPLYKIIAFFVVILLVAFGLVNYISKNTTYYTVIVDINSSIQLKINKSNELVNVQPLDAKGIILVKDLDIKGKPLDLALTMLLEKANKSKYLDNFYSRQDNPIYIWITAHNNSLVPLTSFKNKATQLKITVLINNNGK